jgi:hypothetical protein
MYDILYLHIKCIYKYGSILYIYVYTLLLSIIQLNFHPTISSSYLLHINSTSIMHDYYHVIIILYYIHHISTYLYCLCTYISLLYILYIVDPKYKLREISVVVTYIIVVNYMIFIYIYVFLPIIYTSCLISSTYYCILIDTAYMYEYIKNYPILYTYYYTNHTFTYLLYHLICVFLSRITYLSCIISYKYVLGKLLKFYHRLLKFIPKIHIRDPIVIFFNNFANTYLFSVLLI